MSGKRFYLWLILLFLLANITRGGYRARVAGERFSAEGAAHLRYTTLIARGEEVPSLDRKAQWPEGLRVFRETSIGMEYLYGLIYRLLPPPKPELAVFVRYFTAFFFSLAILPLALLARGLWKSGSAGMLTALLFAVALPLVGRSCGFELIRENITFPLLIYHVYFFVSACGGEGVRIKAVLSGLFIFLALSTWQGTQFYLVPLLLLLLARQVLDRAGKEEKLTVQVLILFMVGAGLMIPFLREGRFLLSLPSALAAAWLVPDMIFRGSPHPRSLNRQVRGRRFLSGRSGVRALVATAALGCVLVPALLAREHFVSYSHFFRLILYKLRYIAKPSDPGILPFDVRAFWVGPFLSPDPLHLFVFALPLVLFLPGPVRKLFRRSGEKDFPALFTLYFLIVFFVLFLMMQRLIPLFGFFAVIAAGGNAPFRRTGGRILLRSVAPAALTVILVVIMLTQDFFWAGRGDIWRRAGRLWRVPSRNKFVVYPYRGDVEGALLSWIEGHTAEDAVILSYHYLSPQVLTYTGRATNLNDFFESPRLRDKAERYLRLLYSGEEELFDFCREQSSDYLLISITAGCDPTLDSPLYQAGFMALPDGCAAARMMFMPETLERFNLVYENEMYRLYRVGRPGGRRQWPRSPLFYEKELLLRSGGEIQIFYDTVMHIYAVTVRAQALRRAGRDREAEGMLREALGTFYYYPAWSMLDRLYREEGRDPERLSLAEFAYRYDPYNLSVRLSLLDGLLDAGRIEGVAEILTGCAGLSPSGRQGERLRELRRRWEELTRDPGEGE
ncbi:MAG: hypothetical protein JXB45_03280 [Candidatus Krumholzibacteriota bacterium]|nr:hypothetical protein [Candidatus Krumholzibacteriota bacterium]